MACPRLVEKLFKTSSGLCGVARACPSWESAFLKDRAEITYIYLLREFYRRELEIGDGSVWEVDECDSIFELIVRGIWSARTGGHKLGFFISSFTTSKCLYPRTAAHPAMRPISNPLPFFLRIYSAPGKMPTNSSQKSYVDFEAFGEVVMSTLGGTFGSSSKLK